MGRCPECNSELERLSLSVDTMVYYTYYEGHDYNDQEVGDGGTLQFSCPDCGEELCTSEEEAEKLLRSPEPEERLNLSTTKRRVKKK